jgi:hypothetical protein
MEIDNRLLHVVCSVLGGRLVGCDAYDAVLLVDFYPGFASLTELLEERVAHCIC